MTTRLWEKEAVVGTGKGLYNPQREGWKDTALLPEGTEPWAGC